MARKAVIFLILAVSIVSLSGCVTSVKKTGDEMECLRNQISSLETQLQAKDEEISNLRSALGRGASLADTKPNTRQIQTALQNAGYNPGAIDGKMGKQTRDAIKAFQSANNLVADGKVGSKTWELLKQYLYKKNK